MLRALQARLLTQTRLSHHRLCTKRTRLFTTGTSFSDPTRPDVYYHLIDPPNPRSKHHPAFAISFLSSPPPSADSSTILGWLPALNAAESGSGAGLNDFLENKSFRDILHYAIKQALVEGADEVQTARAVQTHQGWMHINDDRNVPALGRINDADDIIGSVLVQDGETMPETYEPMPSYRLCTSDGLPQLTPGLSQKLRAVLEQRSREERAR